MAAEDVNGASFAALGGAIERLRGLRGFAPKVAERLAALMLRETRATAAAGTSPDGRAWQATKKGEAPMRNAAAAVSAHADGTVAVVQVRGPEALHHMGRAKGGVIRQVIPNRFDAATATKAAEIAAVEFGKALEG